MKRYALAIFALLLIVSAYSWDEEECLADFEGHADVYSCGGDIMVLRVLNKQGAEYSIVPNETYVELSSGLKIPIAPERSYPLLDYLESCPPCENVTFFSAPSQGIPTDYSMSAHISAGGQCSNIELSGTKRPCLGVIELPKFNSTFDAASGKLLIDGDLDTTDFSRVYTLGIIHKPTASVQEFSFGPDVFPFTSKKTFTSEEARDLEIVLFARNATEGYYGFSTGNTLSFADFAVDAQMPKVISPGESFDLDVSIQNTGTLQDSYSVSLDVPDGWETQTSQTKELVTDDIVHLSLPISAPDDFKESANLKLNVVSKAGRTVQKEFTISAALQLEIIPELVISSPMVIGAETDYTVKTRAYGTASSDVQYLVLPDPYMKNTFEDSQTTATLGKLNLHQDSGKIIEACGLDYDATSIAQTARLALMYANMAKWISKEPEGKLDQLDTIVAQLTDLKLVLVEVRTGSKVETIIERIERFVEDYKDGRDLTDARESLTVAINSFEESIPKVEEDLFKESCTQADEVTLKLFVLPYSNINLTSSEKDVTLTGRKVISLETDEQNVRIQSGQKRKIIFNITNGAETEREFSFRASGSAASWAYLPRDIDLLPGYSKLVDFEIEPPSYVAGEYDFNLIAESLPYQASLPFTLEIGSFEVVLTTVEDLSIEPGSTTDVNVTVKNLGDLTDIYTMSVSGPIWGSLDEKEIELAPEEERYLTFTLAPGDDVSEATYSFTITAQSDAYEKVYDYGKMSVKVTLEKAIAKSRLSRSQEKLDTLVSTFGWNSDLRDVENKLESAQEYIDAGRISSATTRIKSAENDLEKLEGELTLAKSEGGVNPIFVVLVLAIIGGAVFLVYKGMQKGKPPEEPDYYSQYM